MVTAGILEALAGLGGFGGLAALISSVTAVRTSRQAKDSADSANASTKAVLGQFQPDHGNSIRDRVDAIDRKTELLAEEVTILADAVDRTNNLVRDRLKAHDRELARLRIDKDETDV